MPSIRRTHLLIGLAVVVTAAGLFFVVRAMSGAQAPLAAPSPSVTASPERVAQAKPFTVTVAAARGQSLDSTNMYGRPQTEKPNVVKSATNQATKVLERYLNRQFVVPKSRFSAKPLVALLSGQARRGLTKADRAALGVARLKPLGGGAGKARVRSLVLHRGNTPHVVTIRYRATIPLILDEKPQKLVQQGTMVFASTQKGWRADMVDVRLSLPQPPKRSKRDPSKDTDPTPAPSEGTS